MSAFANARETFDSEVEYLRDVVNYARREAHRKIRKAPRSAFVECSPDEVEMTGVLAWFLGAARRDSLLPKGELEEALDEIATQGYVVRNGCRFVAVRRLGQRPLFQVEALT